MVLMQASIDIKLFSLCFHLGFALLLVNGK